MTLRGYFHPAYFPKTTGFNKEGGRFWIGFFDEQDSPSGEIAIDLTVSSESAPRQHTFASLRVHHDGIKVLRRLEEMGFLKMFEEIQASTFYDVVQCCARCEIPITYHGGEEFKEMTPRMLYDMLYQGES